MALATGAQAEVAYIEEVTWGVTPATPELVALPVTGVTPEATKEGYQSGILRSDRQVADFRHGAQASSLALPFEFMHGEFDSLLEGALFGTWATNVLKAGTDRHYYTFEVKHGDISQYQQMTGMMVNSMGLSISTDAVVTGNFAMLGKDLIMSGTTLDTAGGYTAVGAKRSFDSFSGSLQEGGGGIGIVTSLELSVENNLEPARAVGDASPLEYFDGRCNVTGTLSAFVQDATLLNKFLNETVSSLQCALVDPDGNTVTIDIPRIVYTGGSAPVSGEGGIVSAMPFQAVYDSGEDTALKITRSA